MEINYVFNLNHYLTYTDTLISRHPFSARAHLLRTSEPLTKASRKTKAEKMTLDLWKSAWTKSENQLKKYRSPLVHLPEVYQERVGPD